MLLPVLLFSFVVHEFAHAWVARREGDDTADRLGRVTLNPLSHIDLFGTILIPAMLLASRAGFLIGWAKPVPVDATQFRRGRRSDVLVSIAGVTANFLLAVVLTLVVVGLHHAGEAAPGFAQTAELLQNVALVGIRLNFVLAVFNLLPVPPLDGSHLLYHMLPAGLGERYRRLEKFGIAVFAILLLTGTISVLLAPANYLERLSWAVIQWWT